MDTEFAGFVAAGCHHASFIATDNDGFTFQGRVVPYFYRNKEGIEIEMGNMMLRVDTAKLRIRNLGKGPPVFFSQGSIPAIDAIAQRIGASPTRPATHRSCILMFVFYLLKPLIKSKYAGGVRKEKNNSRHPFFSLLIHCVVPSVSPISPVFTIFRSMALEWLKTGIGPLKDLLSFLSKEGKTSDILKKQVLRELRNNLNIFHNAFLNEVEADVMIDMLSNASIQEALKANFRFNKLKPGSIEPYHVSDERNKKYIGWDAEKLVDKIDEKIEELKNIKKMNKGTVGKVKNNITLMLSNLYYRMKLLADFIKGPK